MKKTQLRVTLFFALFSSLGWLFGLQPADAETIEIQTDNAQFVVNTDTLAISGAVDGNEAVAIAKPTIFQGETRALSHTPSKAAWTLTTPESVFSLRATAKEKALLLTVTSDRPTTIQWPQGSESPATAYALPILGEGRYIPAEDHEWIRFLSTTYSSGPVTQIMSLPFWTVIYPEASLTWIVETPFGAKLDLHDADGRLAVGLAQTFSPLDYQSEYRVRLVFDAADPVVGAGLYREHLQATHQFRSLDEKIADRPTVARLAGAPHIYLWEKGPLKPSDINAWRRLARNFGIQRQDPDSLSARLWRAMPVEVHADIETAITEAQGKQGFVSAYSRQVLTRALNAALPIALPPNPASPLPGGHDPQAQRIWITTIREALASEFPDSFSPPDRWGGGLSLAIVKALTEADIETAWLGVENWLDAIWHPEAVAAAKDAGYLVGTYDSYASAHPTDQEGSWQTAQMGDDIAEHAGYQRRDGSRVEGFRGKGVYINPVAIEAYAQARITAVAQAAGLNSYFLDVDATGSLLNEDYTEGRQTLKSEVAAALQRRLAFAAAALDLVIGSESSIAMFAQDVDFSHGITTPYFAWMDPRMRRDESSEYYVGSYWPPETPRIFFEPTPIPLALQRVIYAPEFRLPLYQIALHDSIVTTHHWEFSSLKIDGEQARTELLQLLYMVPPLYHLSYATLERDLPTIAHYLETFAPLHARLFNQQMTAFEYLSSDRLIQMTRFADGTTITANFDTRARTLADDSELAPLSVRITDVEGSQQYFGKSRL